MTEAEWEARSSSHVMLTCLRGQTSSRKLRLFACAAGRTLSDHLTPEAIDLLDAVERFGEGQISWAELAAARARAKTPDPSNGCGLLLVDDPGWVAANKAVLAAAWGRINEFESAGQFISAVGQAGRLVRWKQSHRTYPTLLADVFENPFRPVEFAPEWRTSTAVALADAMYAARDFANLPVLADALEEAGCDNPDVLTHCRGPGPHVRGCWVVDHVLGKT